MAADRLTAERQFHDRQAADRAVSFAAGRADLRFADDDYLGHETWVRPAFAKLGDLRGRRALDFGCGHGMASVVLARRGADVVGFDLSPGYAAEAAARAAANGVAARFLAADGHRLPFPDAAFDAVWGHAVLHHLDPAVAGPELRRVLKPGGTAVFCEPWAGNPLLGLARRRLPYPGKHRTADERPLAAAAVDTLRPSFPGLTVEPFQLLGMARRVVRRRWLTAPLDIADRRLLAAFPGLGKWCRYVVLILPKP